MFAAGWVIGPIRELWLVPGFGRAAGFLIEAPVMVLAMFGAARWVVRRRAVPSTAKARAVMGAVALLLLLVAEILGARWMRGLTLSEYLATFASLTGAVSLLLFLLFALMPMLVRRG